MEVKSILEVAFEWFCECGAFEQLRKQSKCYSADSTVSHRVFKNCEDIYAVVNKLKLQQKKNQFDEYFFEKEILNYMPLLLD